MKIKGVFRTQPNFKSRTLGPPWTQDIHWTSYVRSIYILRPGSLWQGTKRNSEDIRTINKIYSKDITVEF